jgi:hypothetical protein
MTDDKGGVSQWMSSIPQVCLAERTLAIVHVRSPLNGSVRYSLEASAYEQSRVLAFAEQASD